jgi:hypothetical protein
MSLTPALSVLNVLTSEFRFLSYSSHGGSLAFSVLVPYELPPSKKRSQQQGQAGGILSVRNAVAKSGRVSAERVEVTKPTSAQVLNITIKGPRGPSGTVSVFGIYFLLETLRSDAQWIRAGYIRSRYATIPKGSEETEQFSDCARRLSD